MQYLLMCRSLTYAQRGARLLERAGITATVSRAPKSISTHGCAYSIVVSAQHKNQAVWLLKEGGLSPERVLLRQADGTIQEVEG
jgi:hypothetical protein